MPANFTTMIYRCTNPFLFLCLIICPKLVVTDNLVKVPYIKIISKTLKEIKKLTKLENDFKSFNNELKIKF